MASSFHFCGILILAHFYAASASCPSINSFQGYMYKLVGPAGEEKIRFVCNSKKFIEGAEEITCENDVWSAPVPKCQTKIRCNGLTPPANGLMVLYNFNSANLEIKFGCNEGFVYDNEYSQVLRCDSQSGKWSGKVGTCKPVSGCMAVPPPVGGKVSLVQGDSMADPNAVIQFTCDDSLQLIGSEKMYCNGTGHWDGSAPTCEEVRPCPPVSTPANGSVMMLGTGDAYNKRVVFSCSLGFKLRGASYNRCSKGRDWIFPFPTCTTLSTCQKPVLDDTVVVSSAVSVSIKEFKEGSRLELRCRTSNYRMVGDRNIYCSDGRWIGQKPICQPTMCSLPRAPLRGSLLTDSENKEVFPNTQVNFTCNDGLTLFGRSTCQCATWGSFSCSVPVCERNISCPMINEFPNGVVQNVSWSSVPPPHVYSRVQFKCDKGYEFNGSYWRRYHTTQCRPGGKWSSLPQPCVVTPKCPPMKAPVNGKLIVRDDGDSFKRYEFKCDDGFTMNGVFMSTCSRRGNKMVWRSPAPTCKPSEVASLAPQEPPILPGEPRK